MATDILSTDYGTAVVAYTKDGTPMTFTIAGFGPGASFESYRAIAVGFNYQTESGVQFLHTLRAFIYVYTFGERIGTLTISGVAFWQSCFKPPEGDTPIRSGNTDHGLNNIFPFYKNNSVAVLAAPIAVHIGDMDPLHGFLIGWQANFVDAEQMVAQFQLTMKTVPPSSSEVGSGSSGSGSNDTITVTCCPDPIPLTLHAVFPTITGDCACASGIHVVLHFDGITAHWIGNSFVCDGLVVHVWCDDDIWLGFVKCLGSPDPVASISSSATCDPELTLVFPITLSGPCCGGGSQSFDLSVTT